MAQNSPYLWILKPSFYNRVYSLIYVGKWYPCFFQSLINVRSDEKVHIGRYSRINNKYNYST